MGYRSAKRNLHKHSLEHLSGTPIRVLETMFFENGLFVQQVVSTMAQMTIIFCILSTKTKRFALQTWESGMRGGWSRRGGLYNSKRIVGELGFLREEICWCKGSLTGISYFACYCDVGCEDESTLARAPPLPNTSNKAFCSSGPGSRRN